MPSQGQSKQRPSLGRPHLAMPHIVTAAMGFLTAMAGVRIDPAVPALALTGAACTSRATDQLSHWSRLFLQDFGQLGELASRAHATHTVPVPCVAAL